MNAFFPAIALGVLLTQTSWGFAPMSTEPPSDRGCANTDSIEVRLTDGNSLPYLQTRKDSWASSLEFERLPCVILSWYPPEGDRLIVTVVDAFVYEEVLYVDVRLENNNDKSIRAGVGALGSRVWVHFRGDTLTIKVIPVMNPDGDSEPIQGMPCIALQPGEKARVRYSMRMPICWPPHSANFYVESSDCGGDQGVIPLTAVKKILVENFFELGAHPQRLTPADMEKHFGFATSRPFEVVFGERSSDRE